MSYPITDLVYDLRYSPNRVNPIRGHLEEQRNEHGEMVEVARDGGTRFMLPKDAVAGVAQVHFDKLMKAINRDNANEVPEYHHKEGWHGVPVLARAISYGSDLHTEEKGKAVVTKLLECGADPNARDTNGQTALFQCMEYYYEPWKAELLVKYGADLNVRDNKGRSLWDMAESRDPINKSEKVSHKIKAHLDLLNREPGLFDEEST